MKTQSILIGPILTVLKLGNASLTSHPHNFYYFNLGKKNSSAFHKGLIYNYVRKSIQNITIKQNDFPHMSNICPT